MSENSKCCQRHLDDEGLLLEELLDGLCFVDRPYVIKGIQLKQFLEELLHNANSMFVSRYDNENNFTDEEFQLQKNSLENCLHVYMFCDPVHKINQYLCVTKRHLLAFLCKMRQGLSDDFLTFDVWIRQQTKDQYCYCNSQTILDAPLCP